MYRALPTKGPEVIKLFSGSTKLSTNFQLHIQTKMLKGKEFSKFQTLKRFTYHADKCQNANNCWHFNIYEYDQFYDQLS